MLCSAGMPEPSGSSSPAVASTAGALASTPQVGDQIGAYRIESVIQQGGMGEVFLAASTAAESHSSPVVLKRLPFYEDDEDGYVGMFRAETRVMSLLRHPNVVAALDSFETQRELCLALEFVRGRNLLQVQRACASQGLTMPAGVAVHIMVQILEGLHHAHAYVLEDGRALDLVHRDVTPGNILVAFNGAVKITDFGISKSALSTVVTRVGVVKGTTRYLSPEQIRARAVTARSDVFSAAVVLTELLTGAPLFDRGAVAPTLFAIVNQERPAVSTLLPFAAPELSMVLEGALASDPDRRPPTARGLADALRWAAQAQGWAEAEEEVHELMKDLFPEAETAPDEVPAVITTGASRLDLTHLLEVNEPEPWTGSGPPPVEEELRALLQEMVSGSAPLDAAQFARSEPGAKPAAPSATTSDSRMLAMTVPAQPPPPPVEDKTPSGDPDPQSREILDALEHVSSEIDALEPPSSERATLPRAPLRSRWPTLARDVLVVALGLGLGWAGGRLSAPASSEQAPPRSENVANKAESAAQPPPPAAPPKNRPPPPAAPIEQRPPPPAAPKPPPAVVPLRSKTDPVALVAKGPGYITIKSPRGARVYVDGTRQRRRVPIRKLSLKPGRRLIKISKRRRYVRVFEVDVKPGLHVDVTGGRYRVVE